MESLRAAGHAVAYVAESDPGLTDEAVLRMANESGSVLVTNDKDFGELVFRRRQVSKGVVLLRLATMAAQDRAELAEAIVRRHGDELRGAFTVVTPSAVRIRSSS